MPGTGLEVPQVPQVESSYDHDWIFCAGPEVPHRSRRSRGRSTPSMPAPIAAVPMTAEPGLPHRPPKRSRRWTARRRSRARRAPTRRPRTRRRRARSTPAAGHRRRRRTPPPGCWSRHRGAASAATPGPTIARRATAIAAACMAPSVSKARPPRGQLNRRVTGRARRPSRRSSRCSGRGSPDPDRGRRNPPEPRRRSLDPCFRRSGIGERTLPLPLPGVATQDGSYPCRRSVPV